jgi:hypothetical protein
MALWFEKAGQFLRSRPNIGNSLPNYGSRARKWEQGVAGPDSECLQLKCLVALRDSRATFFNELVSHARTHAANGSSQLSKEELDMLRSNEAFQVAEFFYLVEKFGLSDRRKIRLYLVRHNHDLDELIADKEKRDLLGLSRARLEDGLFSEQGIEKVVQQISDGRLRLDQSDLGRLLITLMSPETTRKAIVALAKGGLLTRVRIGQVLVVSNGVLESYFEKHLSAIINDLRPSLSSELKVHA